jgi:hypothetical protein
MSAISKCIVTDGKFVKPCNTLNATTEFGNPQGSHKGIYAWEMHHPEEGPTRTMFGVKSGEYATIGMLFNFCPFCGEKIDAPFSPSTDEGEQQ